MRDLKHTKLTPIFTKNNPIRYDDWVLILENLKLVNKIFLWNIM